MTTSIAVSQIANDLKNAHMYLLQTMDGVTNEVASFMPLGTANPIAGTFAHLVFSEDYFTHGFLKGEKPLFETNWSTKTGISELQPTEWQSAYPKWLKRVTIDTASVYDYAKAVFAATEEYVSTLSESDLQKEVDMSAFGMGSRTVGDVLGSMIIAHSNSIMGEISVLKGIQGLKGYPF